MQEIDLKKRTKEFALRVIVLANALPKSQTARVLGNQLLRAGTSVGANYRSACRARSIADFISKLGIVVEEADESSYWMELIAESGLMKQGRINQLLQEANELTAIFTSSILTAKNHHSKI
ncbi:MAG: four helix bundle protein [Ignavibacteriae bacterium]|nr:four helix bundle protein [Ignavibacteria bacterium]MBI3365324.1 four helix bundle protein [Ignavibacteriota bacterium]